MKDEAFKKKQHINVLITDSDMEQLKATAQAEGKKLTEIVRLAIRAYSQR